MKALIYTGPRSMTLGDAPDPVLGQNENLIAVEAVGICGSDMHAWLGHDDRRPAPLILGHEAAGRVLAGPWEGRRVTVNPLVTCADCPACLAGRENLCPDRQIISMPPREGAFAERVVMPTQNLVEVPQHVTAEKAALAEPLAVCLHAARLAQRSLKRDLGDATCLVQGGGAIGLGSALSLRALGARRITIAEPNLLRAPVLARAGFAVAAPDDLRGPFDVVVDAVGISATRRAASALVAPGGVISHIGLGDSIEGLDIRRMTLQEVTFMGTYTYTAEDFRDTAQGIYEGHFGDLDWAEERSLSEGAAAFTDIDAGRVAAPKIILRP
ncbi:MAG: alcohol dehydrogenase catalytic domain-containing protein [Pseudomonadota bacterium]